MNPVKLKFRHGGEMLVSPIGLRFVEDPDHGPLVLIPEFGQPRGYQLDMTLEEAHAAMGIALGAPLGDVIAELKAHAFGIAAEVRDLQPAVRAHGERLNRIELDFPTLSNLARDLESARRVVNDLTSLQRLDYQRWQALAIHLGLPEGWERHHELAAETKGALVSQAEMLDSLKAHVDALYSELGLNSRWEGEKLVSYRDTDSILTEVVLMQREVSRLTEEASLFTVAERVGELEEARTNQRRRFDEYQEASDKMFAALRSTTTRLRDDYNKLDYSLVDLARWCGSLERRNSAAPFKPEDCDTVFPQLDDRTCVQRQTWTAPQPVDRIETGRIEDEVSRLHGELDARVSDLENRMDEEQSRIRTPWIGPDTVRLVLPEPEKPKSAWKPLSEAPPGGDLLVRYNTGNDREPIREISWGDGNKRWYFQDTGKALIHFYGYEFCPIPE